MWLSLAGCVAQVISEQDQLVIQTGDLKIIEAGGETAPVLEGTETCPLLLCLGDCPQQADALECFSVVAGEGMEIVGSCWQFPAPGPARVDFLTQPCAANDEGYSPVDDGLSFQIVSAAEVEARTTDLEALVAAFLSPGPHGAFPDDWGQPEGEPWQIVEGQLFRLMPMLMLGGQEVAWTLEQGGGSAVSAAGATPLLSYAPRELSVIVEEGAEAEIFFEVAEHSWPLAQVVGVSSDSPASLELVAAYFVDPETGGTEPVGARAVVRDAQGQLVWGSPIVWTLQQGVLAVGEPFVTVPSADYLLLDDNCVPPSQNAGTHTALLSASVDGLTATIELEWTVPEGLTDESFFPSEHCVGLDEETGESTDGTSYVLEGGQEPEPEAPSPKKGGCGCATGGPPSAGLLLAMLISLNSYSSLRRSDRLATRDRAQPRK
jgi:hypothetical protein